MRKKKKAKLEEELYWSNFFYFNVPAHLNEIPTHMERLNFRRYHVDDEGILKMVGVVRSVYQMDLDGTDITNEGIRHLTQLEKIQELRLKNCKGIDNGCLEFLYQIKGLELLYLGGSGITVDGLSGISCLKDLKSFYISADDNEDPEKLRSIAASLPPGCEFIVNHRAF
ncbi:hypothetical protein [Chitinophaga sp. MM2321]|uniref:hypothetical protein n=1 Tax=Chitinophaga sp. MM2321 TaxID=3137178 RepID=UPI0032D59C20